MKIIIVGTGYVGLVTGTCFAEMGNTVICVDNNPAKLAMLKQGHSPIYEPGLEALLVANHQGGRLHFAASVAEAWARFSQSPNTEPVLIFIAVGTPPGEDGSADLSYVVAVAKEIGNTVTEYCVVINKSTVPIGTADKVRAAVGDALAARGLSLPFDVVSNPEFLKEGAAIDDFMRPDRVIVGTDSERARKALHSLYAPFMRNHDRLMMVGIREAEMIKYASNAMLATRISFMNEIANVCDHYDVDIEQVRLGVGSDARIGYAFLYAGCGYGGSCFPKDVQALVKIAEETGIEPLVLKAVEARNQIQKTYLFGKIVKRFGADLSDKVFAVWGLAFKPGTDDMREASSVELITALIKAGAKVVAHDPVAFEAAKPMFPSEWFETGKLRFEADQYAALDGADALTLVTEWKVYRAPEFEILRTKLRQPIIFDGRNQYDPAKTKDLGFEYVGVGRR